MFIAPVRHLLVAKSLCAVLPSLFSTDLAEATDLRARQVPDIGTNQVFVPKGFDSNDDVEVVLDGLLPDTCYQVTDPAVAIDRVAKVVTVTPRAHVTEPPCLKMRVPFTITARIGQLSAGLYRVRIAQQIDDLALPVALAVAQTQDDEVYAPVERVSIKSSEPGKPIAALLEGRFTSTCTTWKRADVHFSDGVIEVLPVITLADDGACVAQEIPFEKEIPLPEELANGRYLLHVRAMSGKALNVVFPVF